MVTINFSGVCWSFVMAISISKLIGFIMAITFTYLISRRFHLGIAAIVAMFVSQTNDVALAYPIRELFIILSFPLISKMNLLLDI